MYLKFNTLCVVLIIFTIINKIIIIECVWCVVSALYELLKHSYLTTRDPYIAYYFTNLIL